MTVITLKQKNIKPENALAAQAIAEALLQLEGIAAKSDLTLCVAGLRHAQTMVAQQMAGSTNVIEALRHTRNFLDHDVTLHCSSPARNDNLPLQA